MKNLKLMGVFAALGLMLAACGTPNSSENQGSNANNGAAAVGGNLPPMTEEEITLTFHSHLPPEIQEIQIQGFMDRFPNITVELVEAGTFVGDASLMLNLSATGNLPDVFIFQDDVTPYLENMLVGDISEFFNADPETEMFPEALRAAGVIGDMRLFTPAEIFPHVVFVDQSLFERFNVEMPSPDWSVEEFFELARTMTIPDQGIMGTFAEWSSPMNMAMFQDSDAFGTMGWNGSYFADLRAWGEARFVQADLIRVGAVGGWAEVDWEWPPGTGRFAMAISQTWEMDGYLSDELREQGINWVPMPHPGIGQGVQPAWIDFGGISSVTEHPREAYELLKWMSWGEEGWLFLIDNFDAITAISARDDEGVPLGFPILNSDRIWNAYLPYLPQTEEWQNWVSYTRRSNFVGNLSHLFIPGFTDYQAWWAEQEIGAQIEAPGDMEDIVQENANRFVQESIERILQRYGR